MVHAMSGHPHSVCTCGHAYAEHNVSCFAHDLFRVPCSCLEFEQQQRFTPCKHGSNVDHVIAPEHSSVYSTCGTCGVPYCADCGDEHRGTLHLDHVANCARCSI